MNPLIRPPARQVSRTRPWARWLGAGSAAVVLLAAMGVLWAYAQLRASLPTTVGALALPGLVSPVLVSRDALGVPTIQGSTREDVARAMGFVHAQDRFFQMDMARRRAAGELAEILGAPALALDRPARTHRFRARARRLLASATDEEAALLVAYSAGVNAGLTGLRDAPFEYLVLRVSPRPWQPEDSVLVLASMFFSLQDEEAEGERRAALLHHVLPPAVANFLGATASQWDTPLLGPPLPSLVPPSSDVFDLRTAPQRSPAPVVFDGRSRERSPSSVLEQALVEMFDARGDQSGALGSNNWAVAGTRAAGGRAIVANDMHLPFGVPNTWYRASLMWYDPTGPRTATGVTLPGLPSVAAGSNGDIAWGFTNTAGDWSDRVVLDLVDGDPSRYVVPGGTRRFETFRERLLVRGLNDETLEVQETVWGPVTNPDQQGRRMAIAWVPQQPDGLNLRLMALETVRTLEQALVVARQSGIPAQNIVIADKEGRIAWTVAGRIPRRVNLTGDLPASWADGRRGWDGWQPPEDYPQVVDPPSGLIVTANNRLVGGAGLAMLGSGDYDPGARARQILEDLQALAAPTARDMLAVHLDDRARLMGQWRRVVLDALTDQAVLSNPSRTEFRRLVVESWNGRASTASVGYRLVRQFRATAAELAFAPFVSRAREIDPEFPTTPGRALEGPVWALLTHRPPHLLDPRYPEWPALILDAVDKTIAALTEGGRPLHERTWGEANTLRVRHVLAGAIPILGRWLMLPPTALPGDAHVPRVQGPALGASQRFAVSPGDEQAGYFHMPGGQSGHPLSPHFTDGHRAWAEGEATAFLPGPAVEKLTLVPATVGDLAGRGGLR